MLFPSVAIVCEYATLNGGERSMLAAVDAMTSTGLLNCIFLAPTHGRLAEELRRKELPHVPLELRDSDDNRLSREECCTRLIDAVRKIAPTIVHANSLSMGRLTGAVAEDLGIPCVAHLRDIIGLSRAAVDDLNKNQRLIAVSHATREFHVGQGIDDRRVLVIYNGVDCDLFQPRHRNGWLKSELGIPSSTFLAATIGQIGLRKGQNVLADAAVLLAKQLPNVHYLLIGERNSQKQESIDFEASIIERFRSAGIENRLHRIGFREDVSSILNEIDLLVHPAHQEPLGRVLLEAAASSVAIVATNVGGTREILEDGRSARLVPAGDASALADAIVELHDDPKQRQRFGDAARLRMQLNFHIRQTERELSKVWFHLMPPSEID